MFQKLIATSPTWTTLPIRLTLGAILFAHGAQKVFGWWGGPGLEKFATFAVPYSWMRPAWVWLWAEAFAELAAGVFVLLGLLTRAGALFITLIMLVALFGVHWSGGFFLNQGIGIDGIEFTLARLGMAVALLVAGGGRLSLDEGLMDPRYRRR